MSHAFTKGMLRHEEQRDANMDARRNMNDRIQWAPIGADACSVVSGRRDPVAGSGARLDPCDLPRSTGLQMADMRMAFAPSGGLRTVGELAHGNDPHSRARFAHIAKEIAARDIIGFMWQAEPWVPMFQFDAGPRMLPRRALRPLFELLVPLYDAWEMASWFARPNQWLSGRRPVDHCTGQLAAVLDVAHLEHFIATGQTWRQHSAVTRTICN